MKDKKRKTHRLEETKQGLRNEYNDHPGKDPEPEKGPRVKKPAPICVSVQFSQWCCMKLAS